MRDSLKITTALVINLSLLATQVFASLPEITFDSPTYTPLQLVGQSPSSEGWESLYGQSSVSANGLGYGGVGPALKIDRNTSEEAWLRKPVTWNSSDSIAFIDFRIKPAATPEGDIPAFYANGAQVAFQLAPGATTGNLWVLHGNDDDSNVPPAPAKWYKTGGTFSVPSGATIASDWVRATLRQDYGRKVWDLFINGNLAAVNLGFDGRGTNLEALEFNGSKAGDTLVDNIRVDPANMLFPDADKDGLPDAWEIANGSNPNLYDRDAIKPGTGKSFLDFYLDQLWNSGALGQPVNGTAGTGLMGTVPPISILASHQPVGSLKGALTVGGDGSASYTIPLDIPKGTGGMEPKIALGYSSNAGNGIMGVGWSLSGLQQITRIGSSLRKDGVVDGVDFDGNDRFALDGQRLICISGVYGNPGSEYRTETDSFSRIKAYGQSGIPGIAYWTVETSSGLTATLGDGQYARISAPGGVISWSVNKVRDTVGNFYRVNYQRDTESGFSNSALNQRIVSIEYTGYETGGVTTSEPYSKMTFLYEPRADRRTFYTAGVRQTYDQRLAAISVTTTDGTSTYENHRYELAYRVSQQTGRSLLENVNKVAGGVSIPATNFEWRTLNHNEPKWELVPGLNLAEYGTDLNSRNGFIGHVSPTTGNTSEIHLTGTSWRAVPFPYAVTTSTVLEFEYKSSNPGPDWAMIGLDENLSTANPARLFKLVGSGTAPAPNYADTSSIDANDYNYTTPGAWKSMKILVGQKYTGAATQLILVNDDMDMTDDQGESYFRNIKVYDTPTLPASVAPVQFPLNTQLPQMVNNQGEDLGIRFHDFTGDGRSDLVYRVYRDKIGDSSDNSISLVVAGETLQRTMDGFEPFPIAANQNLVTAVRGTTATATFARRMGYVSLPVDIDADGRMDFCYAKDINRKNVNIVSNGHGFMSWTPGGWVNRAGMELPFTSQCNDDYHRFNHFQFVDLDGDSYQDAVVHMNVGSLMDGTTVLSTAGSAWMNKFGTTGGWVQNDNYKLPLPLKIIGVANGNLGRVLIDVNGDGLPDEVESRSVDPDKQLWLNTGSGFVKQAITSPLNLPVYLTNGNGDDVGARLIDLNGDGLTDAIKDLAYGGASYPTVTYLNTGAGWDKVADGGGPIVNDAWNMRGVNFSTFDKYQDDHPGKTSMADVNADGLMDMVISTYNRNTVFFNTGWDWWDSDDDNYWADPGVAIADTDFDLPAPIFRTAAAASTGKAVGTFADVNGDGDVDFIGDMDMAQPKVWLNRCHREVIEAVTDGFGARLEVDYTNINDPTPISNSVPPMPAYTPYEGTLPAGQVELRHGGEVVTRLKESDGAGGFRAKRYHYGDYRFDRPNEASLGYGWMEVHDEQFPASGPYVHNGYKRTETSRQYPYAGRPLVEETYVYVNAAMSHQPSVTVGNHVVARSLSTYGELASTAGTGGVIRRLVQTKSVAQKWDLSGTLMAATVTEQPVSTAYDSFGFITSSAIASLNISQLSLNYSLGDHLNPAKFNATDPAVHKSVTSNIYYHTTGSSWILGRLTWAQVTDSRPGETDLVKKTAYVYSANGLLESETIQPSDPLFSTTTYGRDVYGNITSKAVTANTSEAGAPQTRTTLTTYGAKGRFPEEETVTGLGTTFNHYSFCKALLLGTTDLDSRTTTHSYDVFGTKLADNFPDLTRSVEITRFASNGDFPGSIQQILTAAHVTIKWARVSEASGIPASTVYFDSVGRQIVTQSVILTGPQPSFSYQYSVKLYNAQGLEYLTSNPFLGASTVTNPFTVGYGEWTRTIYDELDRAIETIHPDGTSVKTAQIGTAGLTIAGLANQPVAYVKALNKKGFALERWLDAEGRLVQSKDESNQITRFEPDVEGRVKEVYIGTAWQLTNGYDIRGNRILINDLSAGSSTSYYNGFGELRWTKNAKNESIQTSYDEFGRVSTVTRPDDELSSGNVTFTTTYKTSSPGKGKLEKVENPKGYRENYEYGAATHNYGKIIRSTKQQKTVETDYECLTTFNALGLVLTETDAGGLKVIHTYDNFYGSFRIQTDLDGYGATPLWKAPVIQRVGANLVSTEQLAHGVVRTTETQANNGRLRKIFSNRLDQNLRNETLQDESYDWDLNGNLIQRIDAKAGKTENFTYDSLDRLLTSQVVGSSLVANSYADNGNLLSKDDGTLNYSSGSYRVQSAQLKGATSSNRTYQYDSAGQVTADGKRTYKWTAFGQLKEVGQLSTPGLETLAATGTFAPYIPGIDPAVVYQASKAVSSFEFDTGGSRAMQLLTRTYGDNSRADCATRYLGSYEIEDHATWTASGVRAQVKTVQRHQIGNALFTREIQPSGASTIRLGVVLTDHLGSTDVIIRGDWNPATNSWKMATSTTASQSEPRAERQSFDAWGERRNQANWDTLHISDSTNRKGSAMEYDRGFTGHETLDDFALIHMNGRIYDPEIGRFLTPDPYVQVPEYSQNFNRYTYVLNNPLSHTDSSGNEIDGLVVAAIAIIVAVVTYGAGTALITTYAGAGSSLLTTSAATGQLVLSWQGAALVAGVSGALSGGVNAGLTGQNILEGALEGAISGAISGGLLHGISTGEVFGSLGEIQREVLHISGHALLGGIRNEVMGERFQDGLISAAAGAAAGSIPGLKEIMEGAGNGKPVEAFERSMIAGVVGGTAAAIGGGKFANGVYTSAFQHLLNAELPKIGETGKSVIQSKEIAIDYDGDPRAYAPKGSGLVGNDNLGNATNKNGTLSRNVILYNKKGPVLNDEGYYTSMTSYSLTGNRRQQSDYVNGQRVPYVALGSKQLTETLRRQGNPYILLHNLTNGRTVMAMFADSRGGRNKGIEISPAAARELGISFTKKGVTSNQTVRATVLALPGHELTD